MLYPIGIQNFEDLRRNGFAYVDKTHHIHRLSSTGKLARALRAGEPEKFMAILERIEDWKVVEHSNN